MYFPGVCHKLHICSQVLLKIDPITEVHAIAKHCSSSSTSVSEEDGVQSGSPTGVGGGILPLVVHEDMLWRVRIMAMRQIEAQLHSETTLALMSHLDEQGNKYSSGLLEMRNDVTQVIIKTISDFFCFYYFPSCFKLWKETHPLAARVFSRRFTLVNKPTIVVIFFS